jgi:hypothetical protein
MIHPMLVKGLREFFRRRTFSAQENTMEHERFTAQIKLGGNEYVLQQ